MSVTWHSEDALYSGRPTDLLRLDASGRLEKNAPEMAVRYNRRSTMKKLSDLNDHNLPLVRKNLLGSEHSFALKNQMAAENRKLKKTILTWYRTLNWRVKRCTRIQDEYYRVLQKYHDAQRQCTRRSLLQLDRQSRKSSMLDMGEFDIPLDMRRTQSDIVPNVLQVDFPSTATTGATVGRKISVAQRDCDEEDRPPFFVRDRQLSDPAVGSTLKPEGLATLQAFLQFMNSTDDVPDAVQPETPTSAPAMSMKRRMSTLFHPNLPPLREFREKEQPAADAPSWNRKVSDDASTGLQLKSEVISRRKLTRPQQEGSLVKEFSNAVPANPTTEAHTSPLPARISTDNLCTTSTTLLSNVGKAARSSSSSKEGSSVCGKENERVSISPSAEAAKEARESRERKISMVAAVRESRIRKEQEFRKVVDSPFTAYKRQGTFSLYEIRTHHTPGAPPDHLSRAEESLRAQKERLLGSEHDPDLVPIESAPKTYGREYPTKKDAYHRERLLRRERSRCLELVVNSSDFLRRSE